MSKKDREDNRAARAAAIQKAQATKERKRKLLIVGVVLAVLAAIVVAGVLLTGGEDPAEAKGPKPTVAVAEQALVVGNDPDAKVKVVVFEDFLCPYCREFEASSRELLRKAAEQGKVLVEYRPIQILQQEYSTQALTAWAAVATKGTPEQALAFHDLLFENQPYESAGDMPGVDELTDLAEEAGVEDDEVLDALGTANPEFVAAANTAATEAGIKGTPTVIVNGKVLEGASMTEMTDELERLIAKG